MRHSKLVPEVNAGSMADIAFLLLIFFLVTATISTDEGINRLLPKDCPTGDCTNPIHERNILRIVINNNDEVMIENDIVALEDLKEITKSFIDNNGDGSCNYCYGEKDSNASDNPKEAVVSLQNGKNTTYKQFIAVQNELTKAYYELRNTYSINVLKKPSDKLSKEELNQVKEAYPFILSEAEIK
ncbi:biopolymer transporter ExbD [Sabulilitoribacter multivorans]|uniref:Biopolymer transporter ExbD n=1 Tax=Flaviramulus multivorans TaxID=1304750 RepID=A0ABS9IJB4_9FLAO|nr:biopolymer transporter ExbD [Flaviramulus multivorans]MCF7560686.1 biopolymer transporter ExbD [Flaviramulus multivorans]